MTTPSSSQVPQIDFDALYRGESPVPGAPAMPTPPWDTKAPKESVIGWQEAGLISGDVLDIGCGLGDNAIYLAKQGHPVTALDISPTALSTAQRRAADAGVDVKFAVGDATKLDGYTDAFDTVIDSGMFHCLDDDAKRSYLAGLHGATRQGARLLLSCFSDAHANEESGLPFPLPTVSEQTLRDALGATGWQLTALEPITVRRDDMPEMAFWLVQAERR